MTCTPHFAALERAGPPTAAADIEQTLAGKRLEQRDQLLGREHAAAVEMVDRRQRLRGDRGAPGLVGLAQRGEETASTISPAAERRRDRGSASACPAPRSWDFAARGCYGSTGEKTQRGSHAMAVKIDRIQPEGMNVRMQQGKPAYSHVVTVTGPATTIYIAGQLARDAAGNIVGPGDMRAQLEQTFKNLDALSEGGGRDLARCRQDEHLRHELPGLLRSIATCGCAISASPARPARQSRASAASRSPRRWSKSRWSRSSSSARIHYNLRVRTASVPAAYAGGTQAVRTRFRTYR